MQWMGEERSVPLKLDLYCDATVFAQLEPEWNDLVKRSAADMIFSTWEWHSHWWDAYQPGDLWIVTCRDDDGYLLGIAPWFIDDEQTVRAIGCEDVTDYLDVIIDSDAVAAVMNCFGVFLREHSEQFDCVQLCNIPHDSPTFSIFPSVLDQQNFEVSMEQQEVCPVIQLPTEWDDYLAGLNKKHRHELRRKIRRARGNTTDLDWYIVDESHDLQAEMDRFIRLMAASDEEKAGFLEDEKNVAFFKKIVPAAFENGWLMLNFLTIEGEAVAAYLNFDYNNEILVYNSGLSHEQYSNLSPGIVLLAMNIRHGIENGYQVFDFLRGDEAYKYHMGGQNTSVHQLTATYSPN